MRLGRSKKDVTGPLALPEPSGTATLHTSDGGRIPARVLDSGPQGMLLAITVPTKPFTSAQLERLTLEYANPRGRVRVRGRFAVERDDEPDLVRLVEVTSSEVLQERRHVRIRCALPVLVVAGGDHMRLHTHTVDISGGGLLLAETDVLNVGETVEFRLAISEGVLPIAGSGHVVRHDTAGRPAIEYTTISDLDRRRLIRFIFERQRAERHAGVRKERNDGD